MMRVVYRTRTWKDLRLARKYYQAEVGLRRLGAGTIYKVLKRKWKQRSKAEVYGEAVIERYARLKDAEK